MLTRQRGEIDGSSKDLEDYRSLDSLGDAKERRTRRGELWSIVLLQLPEGERICSGPEPLSLLPSRLR
ncbi:hypothetical protein SAY87_029851 [Trapa incisa]|uniref:Uncharacterized protein n=1 Tax=Trapa incisa TaxID=236973 RepID=A0AAN7K902_9MYRT|nr:hypothetical protein SAY87_029851 [Trapa incisa]